MSRVAPYRGQEIGSRRQLTKTCLGVLRGGSSSELYSILPHICLIRSRSFLAPLLEMLRSRSRSKQIFAALALGNLGTPRAVPALGEVFMRPETLRGTGCQSLQTAIICALGESGCPASVLPLKEIFALETPRDFSLRRKCLVVSAWGTLAQHEVKEAVSLLLQAAESDRAALRAGAVAELGVAFWHAPEDLPDGVFQALQKRLSDPEREVRIAAVSALSSLAELGCGRAERLFAPSDD